MKRALLLPSPMGQGDLMIAREVAKVLAPEFSLTSVCYAQNQNCPAWNEIPGDRHLLPGHLYPYSDQNYGSKSILLAEAISALEPDAIVVLNDTVFPLATIQTRKPSVQMTHVFNTELITSGMTVLERLFANAGHTSLDAGLRFVSDELSRGNFGVLKILDENSGHQGGPQPGFAVRLSARARATAKAMARTFLPTRLKNRLRRLRVIDRYPFFTAAVATASLFCDRVVFHSLFDLPSRDLHNLNEQRARLGRTPALAANSIASDSVAKLVRHADRIRSEIAKEYFGTGPVRNLALITLGGYDHPASEGLVRFIRIFSGAIKRPLSTPWHFLFAGKVVETQRDLFLKWLRPTAPARAGCVAMAGMIPHDRHLEALAASDLVVTQPGYSTLSEITAAQKPVILVYGFDSYYEQYENFALASDAGLCLRPAQINRWLHTGAYDFFGAPRPLPDRTLIASLRAMLDRWPDETDRVAVLRENQGRSFNHYLENATDALRRIVEEWKSEGRIRSDPHPGSAELEHANTSSQVLT